MKLMNIDEEDLTYLVEHNRYVPNYDTEIYTQFESHEFELGDYVQFRINIVDNGIIPLEQPYFYGFLVNPSKEVVLSFPDTIYHVSSHSKMSAWSTKNHHEDYYRDCLPYQGLLYIPRKTLIEGYGKYVYTYKSYLYWSEPSEIVFQYYIEDDSKLIGDWKVYVFTYDEEYYDRLGNELETQTNNFIQYSVAEFQVTSKSLPESIDYGEIFNKYIIFPTVFLITFVLNYLSIYPFLEKHKEKLSRIGSKIREHWVFVVGIIIIVIVQIVFFLLSMYS